MKERTKGIIIGLILGFMFFSCDDSIFAINDCGGSLGERGTVEWNPLYVKIVD